MIKKHFYILASLFLAFAFVGVQALGALVPDHHRISFGSNVYYSEKVIGPADFLDKIYVLATASPGAFLTIFANYEDDSLGRIKVAEEVTNSEGKATPTINYTWNVNKFLDSPSNPKAFIYEANLSVESAGYTENPNATYKVEVTAATPVLSVTPAPAPGSVLLSNTAYTFSCSSSTNLRLVRTSDNTTITDMAVTGTNYNLSYTFTNTDSQAQNYTLTCSNIGASASASYTTQASSNSVADKPITISDFSYSPATVATAINFAWKSNANSCELYTSDRSLKLGTGSGSPTADRDSVVWSTTVPASNIPSSAGDYSYYIKCIDTEYPSRPISGAPVETISGSAWLKGYVTLICPAGQVADGTGYCHAPCTGGKTWDEGTKSCKVPPCPENQTWNGSACSCPNLLPIQDSTGYCHSACPTGESWDESTRSCEVNTGPMSGSISANPNPCYIQAGASSCNTKVSWTTTNPVSTSAVTSNYPSANTVVANGEDGNVTASVPYGSRTFWLYNNGEELGYVSVSAICANGTEWDYTSNTCKTIFSGTFDITNISSNPNILYAGNTFSWVSGADACNVHEYYSGKRVAIGYNSGTNWTGDMIASDSPTSPHTWYYVDCYSSSKTPADSNGLVKRDDTSAYRAYEVYYSCSAGYVWSNESNSCVANPMFGYIGAIPTNCTIPAGASQCNDTIISWDTVNPIGTSAVTSNYPSANTVVATGNQGSIIDSVPYGSRTFFLYNNGELLGQVTAYADCGYNVWDASTGVCKSMVNCPAGSHAVGNECVQDNPPPFCQWADSSYNFVSCTDTSQYVCMNGNDPEFRVDSGNILTTATNFPWQYRQYQYRYVCPEGNLYILRALTKPYSHFTAFNVSAGYIKKGTSINLSWVVQDPNSTCQIIGREIATNNIVLNTKNDQALDNMIATSTYSSTARGTATGDYRTIKGNLFQVNSSTRFTASCINPENDANWYEGYHQLVRDVYVNEEQER